MIPRTLLTAFLIDRMAAYGPLKDQAKLAIELEAKVTDLEGLLASVSGELLLIRREFAQTKELLTQSSTTFALRWEADRRAIRQWQEATGRKLVWPDHADLCVWLLEQLDKTKAFWDTAPSPPGAPPRSTDP